MTKDAQQPTRPTVGHLLWLILLLLCLIYSGWRISQGNAFNSNILALLPDAFHQQTRETNLDQRFVLLVSGPKSSSDMGLNAARQLQQALKQAGFGSDIGAGLTKQRYEHFYKPYRQQLLSAQTRQRLQQSSRTDIANAAFRDLTSPLQAYRPYSLVEDPFNLGGQWITAATSTERAFDATEIASVEIDQRRWFVVLGLVPNSAFSTSSQQQLTALIDRFRQQYPSADLLRSGLIFHATEAAQLARSEISTVGIGSILAIIFLTLWVFRSLHALRFIATVLFASTAVSVATCLLFFGQIHVITLAFGSTLLGLAVDYCFHFLVKQRINGGGRNAALLIQRGLVIGLVSSVCAYALQSLSPLPLLQQFAVFMSAGLISACISVLWLSRFYNHKPARNWPRWLAIYPTMVAPQYQRLASRPTLATGLLVALALVCIAIIAKAPARDDIRLLNSSSPALLASEQQVQSILGIADNQRFIEVTAADHEALMNAIESSQQTLTESGFKSHSISQFLPSQKQQLADHQLVQEKLYRDGAALSQLCTLLQSDCSPWQSLNSRYKPGLTAATRPGTELVMPPQLLPAQQGPNYQPIAKLLLQPAAMTRLLQNDGLIAQLEQIPGVRLRDKVAELSSALHKHRLHISYLLLLFLLLFAIACYALYRRRSLPAIASLLLALGCGLASAWAGMSLFHVLALLLIMGLAIDTSIFYLELGLNAATWLASSLALATSALAFGLLALSDLPLLQQFGQSVCAGLLATWLFTPLVFAINQKPTVNHGAMPLKSAT